RTTVLAAVAFLDAFQKVADMATNTRGATRDIGSALTRMCMRHRSIEAKLRQFTNALMESLITPLQDRIEDWKKTANQLDKDHAKEYKRARHEIKKKSSDTLKLQKKARKGKGDLQPQLDHALQDVNDMYLLLEETEKQAVRRALIEERGRFCTFITFLQPVVNGEITMLGEITHLQGIIDDLVLLTAEPHKLPPASEQVIKDLKGSDYSWSYQTPPSSPSSSSSRNTRRAAGTRCSTRAATARRRPPRPAPRTPSPPKVAPPRSGGRGQPLPRAVPPVPSGVTRCHTRHPRAGTGTRSLLPMPPRDASTVLGWTQSSSAPALPPPPGRVPSCCGRCEAAQSGLFLGCAPGRRLRACREHLGTRRRPHAWAEHCRAGRARSTRAPRRPLPVPRSGAGAARGAGAWQLQPSWLVAAVAVVAPVGPAVAPREGRGDASVCRGPAPQSGAAARCAAPRHAGCPRPARPCSPGSPSPGSDYDCYSVNGDVESDAQSEFDKSSTIPRNSNIAQNYRRMIQTKRPASTAGLPTGSALPAGATPGVATIRRTPSTKPSVRRTLSNAGPIPIRPPIVPVKTPTVPDSPGYGGPARVGSEECVFYADDASPGPVDFAKASPKRLSLPNTAWGSGVTEMSVYAGAGQHLSAEEEEDQQLAANRHSLVEKIGELVAGAHALGEGQFPFPTALSGPGPGEETPTPPPAASMDPPAEDMLVAIRRGVRLRRTVTNDRSAPRIL
ncbi:MTSSL protein, partial [Eudromia elegans]|nr:MTSSL protein [Eudromia elegans]